MIQTTANNIPAIIRSYNAEHRMEAIREVKTSSSIILSEPMQLIISYIQKEINNIDNVMQALEKQYPTLLLSDND